MKFFLPDSQDLVDPTFDFERERRSITRQRQRDDLYAHEVFSSPAFDGLLVSKGIVDGFGTTGSRYTLAQRHRLLRLGAPQFFRLERLPYPVQTMGDCGAFTYIDEEVPPYTVEQVLEFYAQCRFDLGVSPDHVILDFIAEADAPGAAKTQVEPELRQRQEITLEFADAFLRKHKAGRHAFQPLGAAQGWSPKSYAHAVSKLQKMGYTSIALGGMVPLKSQDILLCLEEIHPVLKPSTRLHLLGVTRTEHLRDFARLGVTSFDSTSPLRQAFKDSDDNYYAEGTNYTAIRIPQSEGNPRLQGMIAAGQVSQQDARALEKRCLESMKQFEQGRKTVEQVVRVLGEYEQLYSRDSNKSHAEAYRRTLSDAPWRRCPCDICRHLKYHVILFRGAERNRRRGLHNVWTFYRHLQSLGLPGAGSRGEATPRTRRVLGRARS
jgi:hypothetical protein